MSTPVHEPGDFLQLSLLQGWQVYLLTGPRSQADLIAAGLTPAQDLMSAVCQDGVLVARSGRDEYMVIQPPHCPSLHGHWCFPRTETLLRLSGLDWIEVMAQVCAYDFRQLQPGQWLMAQVGGVGCWLYYEADSAALLIGFDQSYQHYLHSTLQQVVADLNAGLSPAGKTQSAACVNPSDVLTGGAA